MTRLFDFIFDDKSLIKFSSIEVAIMEGGHDLDGYRYEFIKSVSQKTIDERNKKCHS
jgi:hypothetical protein